MINVYSMVGTVAVGWNKKNNEKDGKTLSILPTGCKLPPRRRH